MIKNIIICVLVISNVSVLFWVKTHDPCQSYPSREDTVSVLKTFFESKYLYEKNVLDSNKAIRITKFPLYYNDYYEIELDNRDIGWVFNNNLKTGDNVVCFTQFTIKKDSAILWYNYGKKTRGMGYAFFVKKNHKWHIWGEDAR